MAIFKRSHLFQTIILGIRVSMLVFRGNFVDCVPKFGRLVFFGRRAGWAPGILKPTRWIFGVFHPFFHILHDLKWTPIDTLPFWITCRYTIKHKRASTTVYLNIPIPEILQWVPAIDMFDMIQNLGGGVVVSNMFLYVFIFTPILGRFPVTLLGTNNIP